MSDQPTTQQEDAARLVERTYVPLAAGAGILPVPLLDIAAVMGVQLKMLAEVSKVYGKPFAESRAKSVISALVGGVTSGALAASFIKALPGIGSALGGIPLSIAAGASTYAVGHVFIRHYESGGTLVDFEPKKARSLFRDQLDRGKAFARQVTTDSKESKTDKAPAPDLPYKVYCIIKLIGPEFVGHGRVLFDRLWV